MIELASDVPLAIDVQRLGQPEKFSGHDADWQEWSFAMRAYLALLRCFTQEELRQVESHEEPITLSSLGQKTKTKSTTLYSLRTLYVAEHKES